MCRPWRPATARVAPPSAHDIDNRVVVTVFEDLQCPACKQFEIMFGDALTTLRANPDVIVEYRMIFVPRRCVHQQVLVAGHQCVGVWQRRLVTGGDWSTWLRLSRDAVRPAARRGRAGHDDAKLASLALDAGSTDVQGCITANTYADWVSAGTRRTHRCPGHPNRPDQRPRCRPHRTVGPAQRRRASDPIAVSQRFSGRLAARYSAGNFLGSECSRWPGGGGGEDQVAGGGGMLLLLPMIR